MKIRTVIALFLGLFNTVWLGVLFVMLYMHGAVLIPEPSKIISGVEIGFVIFTCVLVFERFCNLREKK